MQNFRNLEVWQLAHEVTLEVYRTTRTFSVDERFGLISQLRRAASSIGANLAEGCGRGSDADFGRFVQTALGSASEVEYHLLLAKDLNYLEAESHLRLESTIQRIKRMLASLLKKLRTST
ncbi:four helix bundle protein [Aeoliella sp. ICT_H6.2]|uniref:Four helix bundle protein n=1 Tax=Aeoliella straminimaris TaxID=2954799 RepID=A0A9X2FBG7_9BACT|nr:four helix bundle protein [Aeoliella straminimaris]MCO6045810.1 four helix bundle protein [Aeoliella straminimaris]